MQLAVGMTDQTDLQKRVRDFALASLTFYRRLPKTREAEVPGPRDETLKGCGAAFG
jgi:hypothetical protein